MMSCVRRYYPCSEFASLLGISQAALARVVRLGYVAAPVVRRFGPSYVHCHVLSHCPPLVAELASAGEVVSVSASQFRLLTGLPASDFAPFLDFPFPLRWNLMSLAVRERMGAS